MRERCKWTEDDIFGLIGEAETFDLEFKQAAFLEKDPDVKLKVGKSVASIAHAAGGFLIYGIKTDGRDVAAEITPIDDKRLSKEWLTETIRSQLHPRTLDFDVQRIPLTRHGDGLVAYVVSISQANECYQTPDFKFWRRIGTVTKEMTVYEMDDVRRRGVAPRLDLDFRFRSMREDDWYEIDVDFTNVTVCKPIEIDVRIHNLSNVVVENAAVTLYITSSLINAGKEKFIAINDSVISSPKGWQLPSKHRYQELPSFRTPTGELTPLRRNWHMGVGDAPIFGQSEEMLEVEPFVFSMGLGEGYSSQKAVIGWEIRALNFYRMVWGYFRVDRKARFEWLPEGELPQK